MHIRSVVLSPCEKSLREIPLISIPSGERRNPEFYWVVVLREVSDVLIFISRRSFRVQSAGEDAIIRR